MPLGSSFESRKPRTYKENLSWIAKHTRYWKYGRSSIKGEFGVTMSGIKPVHSRNLTKVPLLGIKHGWLLRRPQCMIQTTKLAG